MSSEYGQQLQGSLIRGPQLAEFKSGMARVAVTAVSPCNVVSVTIGSAGEIKEMTFPTSAYEHLTPLELSSIIMGTIDEARSQALDEAADVLASLLPAGIDARELVGGNSDVLVPSDEADPRRTLEVVQD